MKIKTNSKEVKPGDTFVALKGLTSDGHDYIEDAIKRGATKIVAEHGEYPISTLYVTDTKQYLISYLQETYGDKIRKLKLIGVTGTNGKTTSCYLIYQMLNKLNRPCAYIGTIGFYLKDEITILDKTTPDILEIYELLIKCANADVEYVAMEVSSHALALDRVSGLTFDYAIFSNLSVDHLDFHENIDDYAKCKQKLFKMLTEEGIAIINNDDSYAEMMKVHDNNLTYGFSNSDYTIKSYTMNNSETEFKIKHNDEEYIVKTSILGKYNIYNLLTMIIVLNKIGFSLEELVQKTRFLKAPPGRMDTVLYQKNSIIIDYAHTPDAVFNILNTVNEFSNGKIYSIIGCGGNRDKSKRSKMTFYATCLSDMVIITSDNPRNEKVGDIVSDMLKNIVKSNYTVIVDRKEAIEHGIKLLQENDVLVILGKGHEDYQIINDEVRYHNDKEYVLKLCR